MSATKGVAANNERDAILAEALRLLLRLDLDDSEPRLNAPDDGAARGSSGSEGAGTAATHDFYRDPAVAEVARLVAPLNGMLQRIASLLREWPGQGALLGTARVGERLLRLPARAPLGAARRRRGPSEARQRLGAVREPRAVSLADELSKLSALVARWRRFELYSWRALMRSRELAAVRRAALVGSSVLHPDRR